MWPNGNSVLIFLHNCKDVFACWLEVFYLLWSFLCCVLGSFSGAENKLSWAACHLTELFFSLCLQAKVSHLNSAVVVIRVMRDLCNRVPTWLPLSGWVRNRTCLTGLTIWLIFLLMFKKKIIWLTRISRVLSSSKPLELLIEKTVSTSERQMGVGESLRRVFECIASGTLLEGELSNQNACSHVVINVKINGSFFFPLKMAPESKTHVRRKMLMAFQCWHYSSGKKLHKVPR